MNKLLFFIFLTFSVPALAQQGLDNVYSLSIEELMNVKVTGSTLTEEALNTVPSAVTIFTHDQIKRMGLDSLNELINMVPGYQSYRSSVSSVDSPFSARGRRVGFPAAEVLLLVDGQRLDEPRTSGIANVVPRLPLSLIERVEFIRGPGSAVYGSNAMMGVINIITRTSANEVNIAYGSFNRYQLNLLASKTIGDMQVDLFGRFDTDDGDNYQVQDTYSPNHINTNDPRKLADINVKLSWKDTLINFQHNQVDAENFYVLGALSNDFNKHNTQLSSISLRQELHWLSVASWIRFSYRQSTFQSNTQFLARGALSTISNPASFDGLLAKIDYGDNSEFQTQWHNDWEIDDISHVQFGAEYRYINTADTILNGNFDIAALANQEFPVSSSNGTDISTIAQSKSQRDIFGLYGQYQYQLFDKTQLTLGVRYESFSSIADQLSPRVGLVHELNEHHSIKLLYGEAFRAPAENELNLKNNPLLLGNKNLKPETVQSWDLIWLGQWSNINFSLGYFENHFKGSILQTGISANQFQYNNQTLKEGDHTKGIEFEASYELNQHWFVRSTYTNIFEKTQLGFREANQLASMLINYQSGKWNANLTSTWQSERENPTNSGIRPQLKEYWSTFGKLSYNVTTRLQSFVQVKNALDEDLSSPSISARATEGIANRGREILAGFQWQL